MSKELLKIRNFSKTFGNLTVLKDISFSVKEGEVVSIIGPSGSGKTTLLRCAALLETVEKGDLAYEDLSVCENGVYAAKNILKEAKNYFGFVFQNFNLFPQFFKLFFFFLIKVITLFKIKFFNFFTQNKDIIILLS